MRRDKKQQIALGIGIALTAGMFSIMPAASAAPVLDHVVTAGTKVDQTSTANVTDISSTVQNNVIDWKDFSVAHNETVKFDDHNYLNVVTGVNTSRIDGTLQGGNNVYIVNPNGVIFGNTAQVDVGNLYVSTRPIDEAVYNVGSDGKIADLNPLVNTATSAAGDIVNMGNIEAAAVSVEGNNIKFMDVQDVKAPSGVTINADGNVRIGSVSGNTTVNYSVNALDGENAKTPVQFAVITNQTQLEAISNNPSGDYELKNNITVDGNYKPIGTKNDGTAATAFSGHFDGNYFTVSGININRTAEGTYGGLFGYVKGASADQKAKIENVGVVDAKITAFYAGGIAGYAHNAEFVNVFNAGDSDDNNTVESYVNATSALEAYSYENKYYGGGIIGYADNTKLKVAYNEANSNSAGIIGTGENGTEVRYVYNANSNNKHGIMARSVSGVTIDNAYTTGELLVSSSVKNTTPTAWRQNISSVYLKDYSNTPAAADINAKGVLDISEKGDSDSTYWRIYEGQTMPLLRPLLRKGGKAVAVYYDYNQYGTTVNNGGQDVSVTYFNDDLAVDNTTTGVGMTGISTDINNLRNVRTEEDKTNNTVNIIKTKAAFYTDQQGYDLVGNNITILPRTVDVTSNISGKSITKEYDGTNSAKEAAVTLFSGSAGSVTGIIAGDETVSVDTSGITAVYLDSSDTANDAADVGGNKDVEISGSIGITNKGNYRNYELTKNSVQLIDDKGNTKITLKNNSITQKAVRVTLAKSVIADKDYDGTTKVKDTEAQPSDTQLKLRYGKGEKDSDSDKVLSQEVVLNYDDVVVEYDSKDASQSDTDWRNVVYSGIKIASVTNGGANASKNYKLVSADGKTTIYSEAVSVKNEDGTQSTMEGTGINVKYGGSVTGKGKINKLAISDQGFSWYKNGEMQTAEREYNRESSYTDPAPQGQIYNYVRSEATNAINDNLKFKVESAQFVDDAGKPVINAGKVKVAYTVTVDGTDKKNYTLNGNTINDSAVLYGDGEITPRTLNLIVNTDATYQPQKPYEGKDKAAVKDSDGNTTFYLNNTDLNNAQAYLVYENTGDDGKDNQFLSDDSNARIKVTGEYLPVGDKAAGEVNYDGGVIAKGVKYTVTVGELTDANNNETFSNTSNYRIALLNTLNEGNKTGIKVEKAADNEGDYVTKATFSGYDAKGIITPKEITDVVFAEAGKVYDGGKDVKDIALADSMAVQLADGDTVNNVFVLNDVEGEYVHRTQGKFDADVEVNDTGIAGGDGSKFVTYKGVQGIIAADNHNYIIDTEKVSDTLEKQSGHISQLFITDKSKLALAKNKEFEKKYDGNEWVAETVAGVKSYVGDLTYKVDDTHTITLGYNINNYQDAHYTNKNSNNETTQGVTYNLAVDSTGNYALDLDKNDTADTNPLVWNLTDASNMQGVIRKVDLTAEVNHVVTKGYDGSKSLINESGSSVVSDYTTGEGITTADDFVNFTGWVDGTKSVTANYDTKNVDSADDTAAGGKNVSYVINLDADSKGNYKLKDAAGNLLNNYTLTGKGHITPAKLHITFDSVSKEYDGNTSYTGTITPDYNNGIKTDADTKQKDSVYLDPAKYNAQFDSPNVANANEVYYTVELTGDDAGNYVIDPVNVVQKKDGEGNTYNTITGSGNIYAKDISAINFDFASISKTYDNDENVAYNHTDTSKFFTGETGTKSAGDFINSISFGNVTLGADDYVINSAVYEDETKTGTSQKVTYTLTLSDNVLNNYKFSLSGDNTITLNGKVLTKDTTGIINKKQLQVSVNNTLLPDKVYNNSDALETTVKQADIISAVNGFVDNTSYKNDNTSLNGRYANKNVAYKDVTGGKEVTTKDVLLDIVFDGNGNNYTLTSVDTDKATVNGNTVTIKNLGKITPRELTADFAYTERSYKGTKNADAEVKGVTLIDKESGTTLKDLLGDTLSLAKTDIVGEFGSINAATNKFKSNGDVNYDESATATNKAGYKGVQYSGLQKALKNALNTEYGNYTIDDTVYYDAEDQSPDNEKGRITRLQLDASDIKTKFDPITKQYDGTPDVVDAKKYFHIYTMATGEQVDLDYKLVPDGGAVYNNGQQDVSYGNYVTYTLNGLEEKEFHNFDMGNLATNFSGVYDSSNPNYNPTDAKADITPRVISVGIDKKNGWVKTYDKEQVVKDANGNPAIFSWNVNDEVFKKDNEKGKVNIIVEGHYHDSAANIAPEDKALGGKVIDYDVKLTQGNEGNYTFDTNKAAKKEKGGTEETKKDQGTGDIRQRIVYVDFDGTSNPDTGAKYGTKIDKQYNNGDTAADEAKKHRNHITFVGPEGDTGLVDTGLSLNTGNINANYVLAADSTTPDGNVARDNNGQVTTKYVHFTDFAFKEDNDLKNNYVIRAKDGKKWLTGSGTIKPIEVAVDITQAPVKDEYDGSTSVKAAYIANATNELKTDVAGTGVSINGLAASFDNANAGSASKGYSYTFNMDNPNYELVAKAGSGHTVTTTGKNSDGSLKVTLHGNDGTIKQRIVKPTVNGVMTKEYDGTPYGTENAEANVSLSNVLNGDMNKLGLTVNAVYDNPEAGVSEDSNELKKHVVTYTLNLTNHNYKLAKSSIEGTGTISRKGLTVVAKPASINSGEVMPAFSGTVEGFVSKDTGMASKFTFASMPTVTNASAGTNPVYGWYNNRISGNFGLNYTFSQVPANATAFTVNYVDSGHNNPDTKVTPTNNIYQQISKDKGSGFGDNAAAALEYVNKNGQVIAHETIDSGEIHDGSVSLGSADDMTSQDTSLANIGIVGGDIVNVDGADAAGLANIEVTDNGTTVNLEVTSLSETGAAADKQAVTEITDMPATADNSSAQIQNLDGRQEIVEQLENKDKDEEKKESEIAIESKSSQNDDEIELKIEGSGVKVA